VSRRDERGGAAVELTLVTPLLVLLLLFVVSSGRLARARMIVDGAAAGAARAASLGRSPAEATIRARDAAESELSEQGLACAGRSVEVDTAEFRAGGSVGVTVTCTVSLADVTGFGLPGERRITQTFVAPVDTYRGTG
jgi:Flp pilus assembly protein TadG